MDNKMFSKIKSKMTHKMFFEKIKPKSILKYAVNHTVQLG